MRKERIAVTLHSTVPVGKIGRAGNFTWIYNNAIELVPEKWTLRGLEVRGNGDVFSTLTVDTTADIFWVIMTVDQEKPLNDFGKVVKIESWGEVV